MTDPVPPRPPAAAGMRLSPDVQLRVADGGRLLIGGYPGRLVRLTPAGAALVARWRAGEPVGLDRADRPGGADRPGSADRPGGPDRPDGADRADAAGPAERSGPALARRLLDAGMVHPVWDPIGPAGPADPVHPVHPPDPASTADLVSTADTPDPVDTADPADTAEPADTADLADRSARRIPGDPVDQADRVDAARPGTASPRSAGDVRDVTVVVPTLDRTRELDRCLRAVRAGAPHAPVLVVDDGSADGRAVETVANAHSATALRHRTRRGASAARNTGLAAVGTPFVAFVDSDVVVPPDWVRALRPYLDDPVVAAVAPRVVAHEPGKGWLAAYETVHSPLDMGPHAGSIRPGSPVPYVPTATLLVRVAAVGRPFDEDLPIGEDVDLEWRLVEAGWTVRHVPEVTVAHEHRDRLWAFVARRRLYARSIGLLDARHPGALPAARLSPPLAAAWLLLAARRPVVSAVAAAVGVGLLARALRGSADHPVRLATRLVGAALPATGEGLARAVERVWWPPLALAAVPVATLQAPVALAVAVPPVLDWLRAGRRPPLHRHLAARALHDLVSTAGTWEGCVRERTVRPLLPTLR